MARVFINWRGPQGRETIDECEGETRRKVRQEARALAGEYAMAYGGNVYLSGRPCANWRD